jgi:serine/threonine-protein kinase
VSLSPGTRLGPYEILSPLGAGGMGEVYRARDTRLGRDVAVKILPEGFSEDRDLRLRFEREARVTASLNHPNVVAVHDVGETEGRMFLVTELVAGRTLREALDPKGWKRAAELGAQIADGLAAAHSEGLVHRDIKPENLIVSSDGRVRILDFGLARDDGPVSEPAGSQAPTQARPTAAGVILGTVGYMAPEQVRGLRCDSRADVFALGCVLFELATGERAFSAPTAADVLSQVLQADPGARLLDDPSIPLAFARIAARCLEKSPDDRFQSMKDLAFALRLASEEKAARRANVPREAPGPAPETVSLAVLPFVNRSADPENEYFADGMTEELIGALSRVSRLRVASRTSVFALKGRLQDVRAIGRELAATAILEGSVRRSGERLRVTAQLTSVADGYHLWSETFDGELRDVFAVQDEIARRIVDVLRDRLGLTAVGPATRAPGTRNLAAYNLYWQGRHLWARRTPESRMKAIECFEKAIAADPTYARAYSGLADCFLERGGVALASGIVADRARAAVLRALELDDSLAEAHTSLARVRLFCDWDWQGAETEFRRAIELDPRYAEGHHSYSHFLLPAGRIAESEAESLLARDLEPLDLGIRTHLGWHYLYSGDFDRAAEQCALAIEMDPTFFYAHFYLGMSHEQRGEAGLALAEFEQSARLSPESAEAEAGRIRGLVAAGRTAEARQALTSFESRTGSSIHYEVAVARLALGDEAGAFDSLEVAATGHEERIIDLLIDPRLRPLQGKSRFREIVRRTGGPVPPG